ncbi:hypothetical protein [Pseudomonas sp. 24 E 13]|nr:hypothetical protein [Pseudomonas sp. 24 E 13]
MEQRPHVVLVEAEPVLGGAEQARHLAVFDHHALGLAGGTGGVDDIGQVGRAQVQARIDRGLLVQGVEVDLRQVAHQVPGVGLHQHRHRRAVAQGVGDAFLRVRRVDRHITGTGLEDAEQADDHLRAALHADRHARVGAHALGQQRMGDLVGALVEFTVGQAALFETHGNRVGAGGGVGFDLLVDQGGVGVVRGALVYGALVYGALVYGALVQAVQQGMAFGVRQDVQAAERHIRSLFKRIGQTFQRRVQITGHALRADGRIDHHRQRKVFTQVIDVDRQRVVGALFGAEHLDTFGHVDHRVHVAGGAVTVIEHRTEQRRRRRHPAATLGQRQGRVLVLKQGGEAFVGSLDCGAHALLADIHAQRQGIDEHAQRAFTALARAQAAEHHGAEHHRLPARHHPQHPGQRQVHQACHTDAQWTRQAAQAQAEGMLNRQARFVDAQAIALHVLQAEGQRWLVDVGEHVAEEGFVGLLAHAMAHLGDIAAKRYRRRGLRLLAGEVQLDFLAHPIEGGVIEDGVMKQQHRHHAFVGRVVGEHQAQQRRLAQVHAIGARIVACEQLGQAVGTVQMRLFTGQGCLAPHHLQRLVEALPGHRRAQDIVAINHPLQRLGKAVQTCAAVEHELRVQHVGVALLCAKMVVEHAFLKRRQGVDILHIRRTAGDRRDDAVDGRLVERDQGQHVRGDAISRARPVAAMRRDPLKQLGFMRDQLVPQRVIQRVVIAQDDQVALFRLQTDRMGGNRCQ